MADKEALRKCIDESGIKHAFIAEKLGVSRQYFSKMLSDERYEFRASQMYIISELLGFDPEQQRRIFFA